MERKFETVKLGDVKSWLYKRTVIDTEKFEDTKKSITAKGVVEPIICRKWNGELQGVAGYIRYKACSELKIPEIPAIVYEDLDDLSARDILMIENLMRVDMADIDVANCLQGYVEANLTQQQIAERIHKSESYVSQYLSLLKDTKPIREALAERTEAFTEKHARLVRALPEKLHEKAIEAVKGKTVKEAKEAVQKIEEQNKAIVVKAEISELESRLKEVEKAEDEKRGLEEQIAKLTGEAKALRFENVDIQRLVGKIERLQLRYFPSVERLAIVKTRMSEVEKVMPTYDVEAVKKERERVFTDLAKAKEKVKAIEEQLKDAREKAKELQGEANKLTESIEYAVSLKREHDKLKDERKGLEETVKDFERDYANEIKNFENLKATVNNANKEVMEKREAIFKNVAELKEKIRALNGKIANKSMIQKRIEQLKADLK